MERAKTFFGTRDHDGYVGKEEHSVSEKIDFEPSQTADKLRPRNCIIDFCCQLDEQVLLSKLFIFFLSSVVRK